MRSPSAMPDRAATRQWRDGGWFPLAENSTREIRLTVEHDGIRRGLWTKPQELEELALGNALLEHPARGSTDMPVPLPTPEGVRVEQREQDREEATEHYVRVSMQGPFVERKESGIPGSISAPALLEIMRSFLDDPGRYAGTGCFHRMALLRLADGPDEPQLVHMVEDIGRHNCLDRLVGYAVLRGLAPEDYALLLSARVTASLYTKARRAGFSFLAGRAAVTRAALHKAMEQKVTLVGFCRPENGRLTVFSDSRQRIR